MSETIHTTITGGAGCQQGRVATWRAIGLLCIVLFTSGCAANMLVGPQPGVEVLNAVGVASQSDELDASQADGNPSQITAPIDVPTGEAILYETRVSLPTYPTEPYQSDAVDLAYNWPFKKFDRTRFEADSPQPEGREYRLIVLENEYLQVMILPELGGRIWQVVHKPTGEGMFYQNSVVKPSPWGPGHQLGWLALGGLEWNAPVIEHGYDWGVPWDTILDQSSDESVSVTVSTPDDGRWLDVAVKIALAADEASFTVEPQITNRLDRPLAFDYWQTAMLTPGAGNRLDGSMHFVLPGSSMAVHSTGDSALPASGQEFTWPSHAGRDLSRLENWNQYLGFFESPAARGPFAGVYNVAADAGAVRVYPADIARGSKVFGLGWREALSSDYFTDDDSAYVELHGGLAPSFAEQYSLPAHGQVGWREVWYPLHGMGDLSAATETAAIHAERVGDAVQIGLYSPVVVDGVVVVRGGEREILRQPLHLSPQSPFSTALPIAEWPSTPVVVAFVDSAGRVLVDTVLESE